MPDPTPMLAIPLGERGHREEDLPGEIDIDLDAARNALGVLVIVPDTPDTLAVVCGCRAMGRNGEDVWTLKDEFGAWHDVIAGDAQIVGRVDSDGWVAWER